MDNSTKIIDYKGKLSKEIIEQLLSDAKHSMQKDDLAPLFKKKIYSVAVECLENIIKHSDEICDECDELTENTSFTINKFKNSVEVHAQNVLLNSNIDKLKEKIDSVNALGRSELKKYYKEAILKANITEKGGAGLGIIDMAKISGNKLNYEFVPIDTTFSCFKLNVKISFYNLNGMNATIIQPTEKSPKVVFDPEKGIFEMEGDSRPENVRKFYQPVIDMLKAYFDELSNVKKIDNYKDHPFNFTFKLGYFNSSSAKFILDILTIVNDFRLEGLNIKINWYFEEDDEDMQEAGEEFANFIDFNFNYIMVKE